MSYSSIGGKGVEYASRATHQYLINDPVVKQMLEDLEIAPKASPQDIASMAIPFQPVQTPITDVFAIDGGYGEVDIDKSFPASKMHFFQFGALHFPLAALARIANTTHPNPEDMARLKNIERIKLALPTANTRSKYAATLLDTVRRSIYQFFKSHTMGEPYSLLDTLAWFIFRQYKGRDRNEDEDTVYYLSSNPNDPDSNFGIELHEKDLQNGIFKYPSGDIYLTDIFRFHEVIDEIRGAAGICGYLTGVVEHLILIHLIRSMLRYANCMQHALLMMDRPTGFFGNTARLNMPMLDLVNWIFDNAGMYMAGIEKSGIFVQHANDIKNIMPSGSFIILNNEYIYKYIAPPQSDISRPFGSTSYYGHKVIFKTRQNNMYVISLPVRRLVLNPGVTDIPNLLEVLTHIEQLKCDMYENALLPISLANRLVSLSQYPGTRILESFARKTIMEDK